MKKTSFVYPKITCVGVELLYKISHISHTALLFTSAIVRLVRTGIKGIVEFKKMQIYYGNFISMPEKTHNVQNTWSFSGIYKKLGCEQENILEKKLHTQLLQALSVISFKGQM